MSRNVLTSSIQNASFSIIFQVLFRCITFVLNAFIIRHVGQTVLGIMNVRLLLLESTILFLSREPIFKACLTDTKSHNWAQVINQIWFTVPLTGLISLLLVYVWTHVLSATEDVYLEQYQYGCVAIAVSCIIDQMTQSVVLVAQSFCFVRLKVILDTIYVMSRTIIFVAIIIKYPQYAIHAFSTAQVVSSIIYCVIHYGFFYWYIKELPKHVKDEKGIFSNMLDFPFKSILNLFPCGMKNEEGVVDMQLCKLTVSFFKQCIVKQILTEGERYVMTISPVLTFSEQAMYDIVNNLGSLAARFIFRPIEESGYFYFTQMMKRGESIATQDQASVLEASTVLSQLCRVVTSIGLLVVTFGQSYSYTLLNLYGGRVLTEDSLPSTLLQFHCFAVLLLAINGVTECYVFATMNDQQLNQYNYIMVLFSITFLFISYLLTSICGSVGFILANCINMTARIVHSIYFITNTYRDTHYKPLNGTIPTTKFIIALIFSGIITKVSQHKVERDSTVLHILIGAICFTLTLSVWLYENRNLLRIGIEKYRRRSSIKID
ncbi:hypothetical protein PPYR_13248 [Photinus pyralis]|uniref:Protein RFT1 homolog n=1 Tax=Photinus pyralis TaxID=7054 RepID=A0A1Y1K7W4_PHOPY|nr:protein RFT1 homolog [Photinus pyralis]KAB0793628.1 hypothetical protein PPYR_13248 [Photinus pyralis]